jgi:light-regulated signal transduction histidine kinase (bacteriophytochrome)
MDTPDRERIAQLEAELQALRAEMQDFTYTVSHDLRASLRHVSSYVQLVQEDAGEQLNPQVQGFLTTAVDAAHHMGRLMDGLMELSRLGSAPVQLQSVNLAGPVQETVAALQAAHADRCIDWQLAPGLEQLPQGLAEPALLRAALGQLLDNAVKFTLPQVAARIEVSASRHIDTLVLSVRDNGVGYNPALQGKLFRPFQRLHSAKLFPGIGMGLALTAKMAQRWGATVSIDAFAEGGCCVQLTLRCAGPVGG